MKVRIPVDSTVLQRASAIGKDSLLTNTFVDTSASKTKYVTKRPGFLLGIGGVTNGTNYGIYISPNSNKFYYISGSGQPIFVNYFGNGIFGSLWIAGGTYQINDQVVYNDGTGNKVYYSAIPNNTNTAPSSVGSNTTPGNTFWSTTPFGLHRWFGRYLSQNGPTTASKESAGLSAYGAFELNKSCATQNPGGANWRIYVGLGTINVPMPQPNTILYQGFNDAFSTPVGACNASPNSLGITGNLGDVVTQLS